jgi:hypothetical protein
MNFLLQKLKKKHVWKRILLERLCEPVHLNLLSIPVALCGSFRAKVEYDLVARQQHAFGLLTAADTANECGVPAISALEFGVASGAGLLNLCDVARRVERETKIKISVAGFDTGTGLPLPRDYRDHPEAYREGDYPMQDPAQLRALVQKEGAQLILGDVRDTVKDFLRDSPPIGFVSIDVDYYSSTVDALQIFSGEAKQYLPWVLIYMDDIDSYRHSRYCCELRAVHEFNESSRYRKITKCDFIRPKRIFQRPWWIEKMYVAHIFDHPYREQSLRKTGTWVLENPYFESIKS